MKMKIFTLGLCSLVFLSCSKDKPQNTAVEKSDSVAVHTDTVSSSEKTAATTDKALKTEAALYTLIKESKQSSGAINKADIHQLPESLKAIAALYSGLGGSNCSDGSCELTTALDLGKQGSQAQKDLVKKWFGNDKAAEQLISQDFYQAPNSSSNFSDFSYLTIQQNGDMVSVNYDLMIYSHGQTSHIKGPDQYKINGNTIETLNRNIWKDVK